MSTIITLDDDVALVLYGFLASEYLKINMSKLGMPERNALRALEGYLEKVLAQPFLPEYTRLLEKAKSSLIERYGS